MTEQRLQDKIRKLLALASDPAAAPQEAETAARQAAKLMALHDIDLATLSEAALKAQWDMASVSAQGCRPGKRDAREVPTWIGIIAWGVKLYTRTRAANGPGVVYFKGPREDVELAKWLHELLLAGCYKGSKGLSAREAGPYRNAYAGALQQRLKAMAKAREASDAEDSVAPGIGTALVKVHDAREKAMTENYGPAEKAKSSNVKQSEAGRQAGLSAAIPTGRPLTGNSGRLLS